MGVPTYAVVRGDKNCFAKSIAFREAQMKPLVHIAAALALGAIVFAAPSHAQMSCSALGSYLATQPHISQFVPPPPAAQVPVPFTQLVAASGTNAARCEANFIYSDRGGPGDGYAVGQNQRIGIRVGFPVNSLDNNGAPSPWNGKVRNIGGGRL